MLDSLFSCWYSPLVRYAARVTGSLDAAEDLVQEVLMRLYRELRKGKTISDPKSWTLCVLRHEIWRHVRHHQRDRALHQPIEVLDTLPAGPWDPEPGADEVTKLFSVLTPREEEVILLRMASLKYREIAGKLGISSNSVNTLLARALRKLQKAAASRPEERKLSARVAGHVPKALQ